jgi:two-component system, response regulator RegA
MRSTVLVIDDDATFTESVASTLRSDGWAVAIASDGPRAIHLLRTATDLHAIVIEPNLTGGGWYQLLHQAGQSADGARLLVVTAFWSAALAQEARTAGAEVCLRKPVPANDVRIMLRTGPVCRRPFDAPPAPCRPATLACVEWEYVNQIIRDCRGNMSQAARLLGIHRPSLYKKLRKHPPLR